MTSLKKPLRRFFLFHNHFSINKILPVD